MKQKPIPSHLIIDEEEEQEEERDLSECPVCGFVNVSLEKELNNGRCFNCDSPLE